MKNKKDLRIVFMGTPDFAVSILKKLVDESYHVVAVITAPDKPAGRGRKLQESAVKKYALESGLRILQPTNLKNEDFLLELKELKPDLQIVVAFRMLPKMIWSLPELGTFNLHASLLPDYRGAAPIHWAIINGEKQTGVTTFFIDEKIDTGEIILSEKIDIAPDETVGSLHDKLMHLGAELVVKTVDTVINGTVTPKKQPTETTKLAPKLTSENTKIDWSLEVNDIYNFIRGLNPFPAAWTTIDNGGELINAKIYEIEKSEEVHNFEMGQLFQTKHDLKVSVKNGFIHIIGIKLAGKKKMTAKELGNGYRFQSEAKML